MLQVLYLLLEHLKEEHLRNARVQAAPMDPSMKQRFGQSAARRQKVAVEAIGESSDMFAFWTSAQCSLLEPNCCNLHTLASTNGRQA